MSVHRARVQGGRLVVDEPTALRGGAVLDLVVDDEVDNRNAEEREALHAHLDAAWAMVKQGQVRPVEEILAELRACS